MYLADVVLSCLTTWTYVYRVVGLSGSISKRHGAPTFVSRDDCALRLENVCQGMRLCPGKLAVWPARETT